MSLESTARAAAALATSVGRAALHHLYPDEFEYYAFSLELLDSRSAVVLSMTFPVMPEQLSIREPALATVRKTGGAVIALQNPTHNPVEISLSGTFGRKLRILAQTGSIDVGNAFVGGVLSAPGAGAGKSLGQLAKAGGKAAADIARQFSFNVKTGYGTTRLLRHLLELSLQPDAYGQPQSLYIYCQAFNANYLVQYLDKTFSQDLQSNGMWRYSAAFKSLAPADNVRDPLANRGSVVKSLAADLLQKGTNQLASAALQQIQPATTRFGQVATIAGKGIGNAAQFVGRNLPRITVG